MKDRGERRGQERMWGDLRILRVLRSRNLIRNLRLELRGALLRGIRNGREGEPGQDQKDNTMKRRGGRGNLGNWGISRPSKCAFMLSYERNNNNRPTATPTRLMWGVPTTSSMPPPRKRRGTKTARTPGTTRTVRPERITRTKRTRRKTRTTRTRTIFRHAEHFVVTLFFSRCRRKWKPDNTHFSNKRKLPRGRSKHRYPAAKT